MDVVGPRKAADTFVAPNAKVIGHVTLGQAASVWYGAVLRGEAGRRRRGGAARAQQQQQ